MHPILKMIHDFEVAQIQKAIREKRLTSGKVITYEAGDTFETSILVLPIKPIDNIKIKFKLGDDGLKFEDAGA